LEARLSSDIESEVHSVKLEERLAKARERVRMVEAESNKREYEGILRLTLRSSSKISADLLRAATQFHGLTTLLEISTKELGQPLSDTIAQALGEYRRAAVKMDDAVRCIMGEAFRRGGKLEGKKRWEAITPEKLRVRPSWAVSKVRQKDTPL